MNSSSNNIYGYQCLHQCLYDESTKPAWLFKMPTHYAATVGCRFIQGWRYHPALSKWIDEAIGYSIDQRVVLQW